MNYAGKHVAITGGAGDLGFAMAREFAREGAEITLLDTEARADAIEAAQQIGARFRMADVTDRSEVEAVFAALPPIDVAVANASVHRGARFLDIDPAAWKLQKDVNVTGVFNFSQVAARAMVARKARGVILITGSWVQDVPNVDNTAYCVSKAAARMLARCMALELGPLGVRVNVVAPGIVSAGMAKRQMEIDPAFARKAAKAIPLGALRTAEQVAKAAAFPCSDATESITGASLLVDGGTSLFKFE